MRLTNPLTETADGWREAAEKWRKAKDPQSVEHCLAVALAWEAEAARLEAEELIALIDEDEGNENEAA